MDYYNFLKNRFSEDFFKGKKTKESAIEKAYSDMSRRAAGHKPEMKEKCVEWLSYKVFNTELPDITSEEAFDEWHKKTCEELKSKCEMFGTIGRSQKVINMAFKYLSCVDDTYDHVLPYCHMTLDSYTLNWYKTIISEKEKKNLKEWSKIDDYENEYYSIQKKIREHLKDNQQYFVTIGSAESSSIALPTIPFEAEFVIWEGEIIKVKYNTIIKELNNYKNKGKEKDEWLIGQMFDDYLNDYDL